MQLKFAKIFKSLFIAGFVSLTLSAWDVSAIAEPSHGIAMHGKPALAKGFSHLPYVNPDAPKGGKITYGVRGNFDSLNPFIVKSIRTTARGVWDPVFGNFQLHKHIRSDLIQ